MRARLHVCDQAYAQTSLRAGGRCSDLLSEERALPGVVGALGDDLDEVVREHERDSLPVDAELLLPVIQKVTEVDVENLQKETLSHAPTSSRAILAERIKALFQLMV